MTEKFTLEQMNAFGAQFLPGHMGIRFTGLGDRIVEAELDVRQDVLAPNGFLHAGTVVTLADSACGYGCIRELPEGAQNFTTIELKSNFLGTAREGTVKTRAEMIHGGRTTQVWDARVFRAEDDRTIALFRCTQMILYPKSAG